MALINRVGGGMGIRPVGVQTDCWSQNILAQGRFVTQSTRERLLRSGIAPEKSTDLGQPGLQGQGRFSRSADGAVLWNLAGQDGANLRLERISDTETGSFRYLLLPRSSEVTEGSAINGTVLALSADCALVMDGTAQQFTGFRLVRHSGGNLTVTASGLCANHPARPDWVVLPGPDADSFFYLSRDRYLMKGTAQGGAISFTVADGESYRNREQLYYADEGAWNRLYGGRLADGNLLVCWNRVSRVLSSGQEEEQDPELGTLYWPYETYRYDLMVSLLDAAGTPLDTVALATELTGSRGTLFAGPLAPPLLLADGRAVLCLNLQNGHPAAGRAARLVAVEAGKLVLQEAPEVFLEEARWEKLADVEGDSILARVTAWGDTGPRAMDRFRPQLAYYRMRGDRVTRLYRADCPGETVSTAQAGSYHWNAEWSAAGRVLVFGGRWSPRAGDLVRLVARWESGYREGAAGESYAGLCVRGTDQNGTFGLMAPGEA